MPAIRWRSERGQALPALVLIATGLVAFTVLVIVPLGSATDRRAEARTAADAAALAAVDAVAENARGLGTLLPPGLGGDPGNGKALLNALERLDENGAAAAADYAARNGGELVDFSLTLSVAEGRPVVRAYARTRGVRPVETTDQHAYASATAEVRVLSGLCPAGNAWGLELDDGTCRGVADLLDPPPTPSPTPSGDGPSASASPSPTESPSPLPGWRPLRLSEPILVD